MRYQLADELQVTERGAVRIVTLNRPEQQNATNPALHEALALVWSQLAKDQEARVVVLTGAGKSFCAGGDLDWLSQMGVDDDERRRVLLEARAIVTGLADLHLPIVAAVNGPAVGLGFSIALLCDLVYMADSAFFADPHVVLGLAAADGAVMAMPLLASLMRAKEYILLGDRITATEAFDLGLVSRVVPAADVLDQALAVADRLAALPARACQETKRLLNRVLVERVYSSIDQALGAESECFLSADHHAALERIRARTNRG